ncbi:putative oxidoreductase [Pseudohyphozyma bogoriensis]|nr:putative oxidoreductase [Pseudohyphozyma bogoriensis]
MSMCKQTSSLELDTEKWELRRRPGSTLLYNGVGELGMDVDFLIRIFGAFGFSNTSSALQQLATISAQARQLVQEIHGGFQFGLLAPAVGLSCQQFLTSIETGSKALSTIISELAQAALRAWDSNSNEPNSNLCSRPGLAGFMSRQVYLGLKFPLELWAELAAAVGLAGGQEYYRVQAVIGGLTQNFDVVSTENNRARWAVRGSRTHIDQVRMGYGKVLSARTTGSPALAHLESLKVKIDAIPGFFEGYGYDSKTAWKEVKRRVIALELPPSSQSVAADVSLGSDLVQLGNLTIQDWSTECPKPELLAEPGSANYYAKRAFPALQHVLSAYLDLSRGVRITTIGQSYQSAEVDPTLFIRGGELALHLDAVVVVFGALGFPSCTSYVTQLRAWTPMLQACAFKQDWNGMAQLVGALEANRPLTVSNILGNAAVIEWTNADSAPPSPLSEKKRSLSDRFRKKGSSHTRGESSSSAASAAAASGPNAALLQQPGSAGFQCRQVASTLQAVLMVWLELAPLAGYHPGSAAYDNAHNALRRLSGRFSDLSKTVDAAMQTSMHMGQVVKGFGLILGNSSDSTAIMETTEIQAGMQNLQHFQNQLSRICGERDSKIRRGLAEEFEVKRPSTVNSDHDVLPLSRFIIQLRVDRMVRKVSVSRLSQEQAAAFFRLAYNVSTTWDNLARTLMVDAHFAGFSKMDKLRKDINEHAQVWGVQLHSLGLTARKARVYAAHASRRRSIA